MERYMKLNAELVQHVEEYKRKQRLYELENLQLKQQALRDQRIIREQQQAIEAFVNQNTKDLTDLLQRLVQRTNLTMTVVTDFGQQMIYKLQNLLMQISQNNVVLPVSKPPTARHEQPETPAEHNEETLRPVRAHRSLSPPRRTRNNNNNREEEDEKEEEAVKCPDSFVTKRRRNNSQRHSHEEEEAEEVSSNLSSPPAPPSRPPPCEPITLPDGMLSTIPETSMDGVNLSMRDDEVEDEEDDDEDEDEEEEEEEEQPQEEPEEVDKENKSINEAPGMETSTSTTSTPKPDSRKRMISSRSVFSPVDTNTVEARVKRSRTKATRNGGAELDPHDQQLKVVAVEDTPRPRRRAAPQTLAEPSLRDKLRR